MSAIQNFSQPPPVTEHADWNSVRLLLDNWAVADKFTYRTPKKDKHRATYACAEETCSWRCSASIQKDGMIKLRITEAEHSCVTSGVTKFAPSSGARFLDEAVPQHLKVGANTSPREIMETIKVHYSEDISYKVALNARNRLLDGGLGAYRYSFQLLPQYRDSIAQRAPGSHVDLQVERRSGNFQRIFVCPSCSRRTFQYSRRFVAVDGTFLKGRFALTLLVAVGIDANGNNVLLAWAIVESENKSSWEYFFHHLRIAIPEISSEICVLVSDRDKGLAEADSVLGPNVIRGYCCKHIESNIRDKFSAKEGLLKLFWEAARARSEATFDYRMQKIRDVNPRAYEYISSIDPRTWATAHFPVARFGHLTSNVAESVNKVVREDRGLPVTDLLNELWHRVMNDRYDRLEEARRQQRQGAVVTPLCATVISRDRKWATANSVQRSSPIEARVMQPDGVVYLVNLGTRSCGCGRFQENGIPCGHAMSLIFNVRQTLDGYIQEEMTITRWVEMYSDPLPPIDISGLRPQERIVDEEWVDDDGHDAFREREPVGCNPPATRVPRGRPRKVRMDKGQYRASRGATAAELGENGVGVPERRGGHCRTCGEVGHNTRTCRRPHQ